MSRYSSGCSLKENPPSPQFSGWPPGGPVPGRKPLSCSVLTIVFPGCLESPNPPHQKKGSNQDPVDRMWSYTGFSPPSRSQCEPWKFDATCRSVLLHMQSLPVSVPTGTRLSTSLPVSISARRRAGNMSAGHTLAANGWGIRQMVAWWAGGCHMGCMREPCLGTARRVGQW
jgi:hypothetical protein